MGADRPLDKPALPKIKHSQPDEPATVSPHFSTNPMKIKEIIGPFFEDFTRGQRMEPPPAVTLTRGHMVLHQALFGDRLRLPLDQELCQKVSHRKVLLANPHLFFNMAVGLTTYASQNVKGNLFYRGLVFKKPAFIGDTITATTQVVALRQNKFKAGRAATGMVVLEMRMTNQHQEELMHFWRCPMIPCRNPHAETGHADSLAVIPAEIPKESLAAAVPKNWDLAAFRKAMPGEHFEEIEAPTLYRIHSRDTVTAAPELARATLNMAHVHVDAHASPYQKRLVYGGHTLSMAAAQIMRALPNVVTIIAWRTCDHTAPVFENDTLRTEVQVLAKHPLETGGLLDLHAEVYADRAAPLENPAEEIKVLDGKLVVLMA